jgi:hypothetical protein
VLEVYIGHPAVPYTIFPFTPAVMWYKHTSYILPQRISDDNFNGWIGGYIHNLIPTYNKNKNESNLI